MKKSKVIRNILIVLVVILVLLTGVYFWQAENIRALYNSNMYSEDEILEQVSKVQEDAEKEISDKYSSITLPKITPEDEEKIMKGEISLEEIAKKYDIPIDIENGVSVDENNIGSSEVAQDGTATDVNSDTDGKVVDNQDSSNENNGVDTKGQNSSDGRVSSDGNSGNNDGNVSYDDSSNNSTDANSSSTAHKSQKDGSSSSNSNLNRNNSSDTNSNNNSGNSTKSGSKNNGSKSGNNGSKDKSNASAGNNSSNSSNQSSAGKANNSGKKVSAADKVVGEHIGKMYGLKAKYLAKLGGLERKAAAEYAAARKSKSKQAAMSSVAQKYMGTAASYESTCDSEVEKVLSNLESKLSAMGEDTSVVTVLRNQYYSEKSLKKAYYLKSLTGR